MKKIVRSFLHRAVGRGLATLVLALALCVPASAINPEFATADLLGTFDYPTTGANPIGGLVKGPNGEMWGMAQNGGLGGAGTVFKVTVAGGIEKVADLDNGMTGGYPQGSLVRGRDGNFYGLTYNGGVNFVGTVIKVTADGVLTKIADFDAASGYSAVGDLVEGPVNGVFYGMTPSGGSVGYGTVFSVTAGGTITVLADLDYYGDIGGNPAGSLVLGSDGNLYGATRYGGLYGLGAILKVTPAGVVSVVAPCQGSSGNPLTTLVEGAPGVFYGATETTVFKFTTADGLTTQMAYLDDYSTGRYPRGPLVLGGDGNLYGSTSYGPGYYGTGSVFQITPDGTLTLVSLAYDYYGGQSTGGTIPAQTLGGLLAGDDGNFYGMGQYTGYYGPGGIYRLNTLLVPSVGWVVGGAGKYVAPGSTATAANGTLLKSGPGVAATTTFTLMNWTGNPVTVSGISLSGDASITLSAGTLPVVLAPGETREFTVSFLSNSAAGDATVTIQSDDATTPNYTFAVHGEVELIQRLVDLSDSANGTGPQGDLLLNDGIFYGLLPYGGAYSNGTAFSVTADGVFTKLADFSYSATGAYPQGSLVKRGANFYGMATEGGAYNVGTIFELTPAGVLTKLVDLNLNTTGGYPYGDLVLGSDGNLYGMTASGGVNGHGTIFKLTPDNTLTKLVDLNYNVTGGYPYGSLVEVDGVFYGTTNSGGPSGYGTIFKVTSTGELTVLVQFDYYTTGGYSNGSLVRGQDGNLYGMANGGGLNYYGTAFKLTPGWVFTKLMDFDSTTGGNPNGNLVQASDGNFYGVTSTGGVNGYGTAIKLTPDGVFTKLGDFNESETGRWANGSLVEGPDGNLYGMAGNGGPGGQGTIFKVYITGGSTISDHFTGGDGGLPPGWTLHGFSDPAGTVNDEPGTLVRITDRRANAPTLLVSESFGEMLDFDLTVDIASMTSETDGEPEMIVGLGNLGSGSALLVKFNAATGVVKAGNLALGTIGSYAGGAISFNVTGDGDSLRVTSTAYGFDSGDVLYSTSGAGFDSIDDLGTTLAMVLATECAGSVTGSFAEIAYDRVVLATTPAPTVTTAPNLVVEYPAGTVIASGATIDFGSVVINAVEASRREVMIRNTGDATLTIAGEYITGAPGTYAWGSNGEVTELAPGASATVSWDFWPSDSLGATPGAHAMTWKLNTNDTNTPAFSINFTGTAVVPAPEMVIEQPAGTEVAHNGSVDFGSSMAGTPVTLFFTIRNTGTGDLSVGSIGRIGGNFPDFDLGQSPATTVVAGGSTSFSIIFTPSALGSRTTQLQVSSDDSDENPYRITLNGTGTPIPQAITFDLPATATTAETIALSANGGASGNPVTFSVQSGPGEIGGGNQLSFTGAGSVVVRAIQAGGGNYSAAPDVDRTIVVTAAAALVLQDDYGFATGTSVLIDVVGNDSGAGPVTLVGVNGAGTRAKIEAGKIRFTPVAPISAPVTFTYTATDGVTTDSATVTVRPFGAAAGTYVGLLKREDGTVRGRVIFTATTLGQMTGQMRYEGRQYVLKGGVNWTELPVTGTLPQPRPAVLGRGAPDVLGQPTFTLTVPDSIVGQTLSGTFERSPYNVGSPTPQAGLYSIVAELPDGGSGPALAGALTCSIKPDGTVKFGGKTGNGLAVTQAGKVLNGGRLPFFVSSGVGTAMQGLAGELLFDRSGSPDVTGTLRWRVPAGTPRVAAGVNQDYDVNGQTYTPALTATGMFNPAAANATLTLTIPSLGVGSPVVRMLPLAGAASRGLQRVYLSAPNGGYITFTVGTGYFNGVHVLNNAVRNYFGVVLQGAPANEGRGVVLDTASLGGVTLAP